MYKVHYIKYEGCQCRINHYDHGMDLYSLTTNKDSLGKGYSKVVLQAAKKYAKKHGKRLWLEAGAYGHKAMPTSLLLKMYIKAGFKPSERWKNEFFYYPQGRVS